MIHQKTLSQISYLLAIDSTLLAKMRGEILSESLDWQEEYSEYQSGGWHTVSLMNKSGIARDVRITDTVGEPTEVLLNLPATREFLEKLGLSYMWVRLANMKPGASLWEHADYAELVDRPRLRLHVPLTEERSAYLILNDYKIHMNFGYLWKLDPRTNHAAVNFGVRDRIHMIMDCYIDKKLEELIEDEMLRADQVIALPRASEAALTPPENLNQDQLEIWFKKLFFMYNLQGENTYSLLASYYDRHADSGRADYWREVGRKFLPNQSN
jgi:hypothetical protein